MEYNSHPVSQAARPIATQESNIESPQIPVAYVEFRLRDGTSIFVPIQETLVPVD